MEEYGAIVDDVGRESIGIVDCVTKQRGGGELVDDARVKYAASPVDMAGIGIKLSEFLEEFYSEKNIRRNRILLYSLSTMLMYADLRRVYQFVHVITGRVQSSDFAGVFSVDTVPGDEETVARLVQLFDSIVEVREDPRELRVRGGDFGPAEWTAF
jgi:hypothetical protein